MSCQSSSNGAAHRYLEERREQLRPLASSALAGRLRSPPASSQVWLHEALQAPLLQLGPLEPAATGVGPQSVVGPAGVWLSLGSLSALGLSVGGGAKAWHRQDGHLKEPLVCQLKPHRVPLVAVLRAPTSDEMGKHPNS